MSAKILPPYPFLAALDLGSNSFRLEISKRDGFRLKREVYLKETVRLGAGLDDQNHLSDEAIERGVACLSRFGEQLRAYPPDAVRAVATQTLRAATNAEHFLLLGEAALGFPIEVIPGREEARLIYSGVSHLLPRTKEQRLVIDIGGGSTEMIIGQGLKPKLTESFKVGSVSVSRRFFADDKLTDRAIERAIVGCEAVLEEARVPYTAAGWDQAHGASGTIGALAEIARAEGNNDSLINIEMLDHIERTMLKAGRLDKVKLPGLKADRLPVLPGGYAVLRAVFNTLGLKELLPAKGALRHGVLYGLLDRQGHDDAREQTVRELQVRFESPREQSARVAEVALRLFAGLEPRAHANERAMLRWAAQLHEIGFAVSHGDYHRHSAYLLEHGDLPGFSLPEQRRLAQLALAQRGNLLKVRERLAESRFQSAVFALRGAVMLCHAREPMVPKARAERTREGLKLVLESEWLQAHPQSQPLMEEEIEHWQRVGVQVMVQ